MDRIVIGNNVNIGAGTMILDTNMHSTDWRIRADRCYDSPEKATKAAVVLEDNVFVGARCIIGKSVTIGTCSMISAGSVVVKGIPANCIAGCNPCEVIKKIENYLSMAKIFRGLEMLCSIPKSFYVSWKLTSFKGAFKLPVICRYNCKILNASGEVGGGGEFI